MGPASDYLADLIKLKGKAENRHLKITVQRLKVVIPRSPFLELTAAFPGVRVLPFLTGG